MSGYFLLVFSWIIFGTVHSMMASEAIKNVFGKILGNASKFYRIFYNFVAIATLLLVVDNHFYVEKTMIFQFNPLINKIGIALMLFSIIMLVAVILTYDVKEFTGFDTFSKTTNKQEFIHSIFSKQVRHPMYTCLVLLMIGYCIYEPSFRVFISTFFINIYLQIGIYFEEKKLIRQFGNTYVDYKNKTPKLIPIIFKFK